MVFAVSDPIRLARMVKKMVGWAPLAHHLIHHPDEQDGVFVLCTQYFVLLCRHHFVLSLPASLLSFPTRSVIVTYTGEVLASLEESRLGSQPRYNPLGLPNRYDCCDRNLLANRVGGGFLLDTPRAAFV